MNEEQLMIDQNAMVDEDGYVYSYPNIPYFLLDDEIGANKRAVYFKDFGEICKYYEIYKKGARFIAEGSNADYIPSEMRYKKSAMILNKEARFLFANKPTFNVNVDDVKSEENGDNAIIQDYLDKVFEKTKFHSKLMKAAKDCFIGKRVAIVLNFNNETNITITFLKATEFVYELEENGSEEIKKFVTFHKINQEDLLSDQRWIKKVYTKEYNGVYIKETIFDGTGEEVEVVTKRTKIKFNVIPVVVILNDGLTGDLFGESELAGLIDYEKNFSKLANADMDAERKSMNPIRYTIDASEASTRKLSTSPGSYWDLQTDEEKPEEKSIGAKVGTLEAQMNYSNPLKTTLERIENQMYTELDVPNITSEQLSGVITSGKTIQALYWGLTVRCDEKMLAWAPELAKIAYLVIEGGKLYPTLIKKYTKDKIPDIDYDILVENNYPLPEDVKDEKELDIAEVEARIMSRKSYLKKWRKLNDQQADDEIEQIKYEQELLENSVMNYSTTDTISADNQQQSVFSEDGVIGGYVEQEDGERTYG